MSFLNLAAEIKAIEAQPEEKLRAAPLGAVVLAPSGDGKSYLCGTLGCKTLYVHGAGENHGKLSAMIEGRKDIIPICYDRDAEGNKLDPNQAYQRILAITSSFDAFDEMGIKAIAIDGLAELEIMVRGTIQYTQMCKTDKGKHNSFAEGDVTYKLLRPIIDNVKTLQETYGIHYIFTCILEATSRDLQGFISEGSVSLRGRQFTNDLIRNFDDIFVVSGGVVDREAVHKIMFNTKVVKKSTGLDGAVKMSNFNPRVTGLRKDQLPSSCPANLAKLIQKKQEIVEKNIQECREKAEPTQTKESKVAVKGSK